MLHCSEVDLRRHTTLTVLTLVSGRPCTTIASYTTPRRYQKPLKEFVFRFSNRMRQAFLQQTGLTQNNAAPLLRGAPHANLSLPNHLIATMQRNPKSKRTPEWSGLHHYKLQDLLAQEVLRGPPARRRHHHHRHRHHHPLPRGCFWSQRLGLWFRRPRYHRRCRRCRYHRRH